MVRGRTKKAWAGVSAVILAGLGVTPDNWQGKPHGQSGWGRGLDHHIEHSFGMWVQDIILLMGISSHGAIFTHLSLLLLV